MTNFPGVLLDEHGLPVVCSSMTEPVRNGEFPDGVPHRTSTLAFSLSQPPQNLLMNSLSTGVGVSRSTLMYPTTLTTSIAGSFAAFPDRCMMTTFNRGARRRRNRIRSPELLFDNRARKGVRRVLDTTGFETAFAELPVVPAFDHALVVR